MYSEECRAVVIDLGSLSYRIGYSGDCFPKHTFHSCIGIPKLNNKHKEYCVFPLDSLIKRDLVDVAFPFMYDCSSYCSNSSNTKSEHKSSDDCLEAGGRCSSEKAKKIVRSEVEKNNNNNNNNGNLLHVQTDVIEKLIEEGYSNKGIDENLNDRPLILTEPNKQHNFYREKLAEVLFESLNVPSLFLCKKATLAAYGCGRTSCLVLDSGGVTTSVCTVHEGYILPKSVQEYPIGSVFTDILTYGLMQNYIKEKEGQMIAAGGGHMKKRKLREIYPCYAVAAEMEFVNEDEATSIAASKLKEEREEEKHKKADKPKQTWKRKILAVPHVCKSYMDWSKLCIANSYKESYCSSFYSNREFDSKNIIESVDLDNNNNSNNNSCAVEDKYVLPDGTLIDKNLYDDFIPNIFFSISSVTQNPKYDSLLKCVHIPSVYASCNSLKNVKHAGNSSLYFSAVPLTSSFLCPPAPPLTSFPSPPSPSSFFSSFLSDNSSNRICKNLSVCSVLQSFDGIVSMINACLNESTYVSLKDVLGGIVVTGGCSLLPGFLSALKAELNKNTKLKTFIQMYNSSSNHFPWLEDAYKNKLEKQDCLNHDETHSNNANSHNSVNNNLIRTFSSSILKERINSTWVGGSIIGSLGSFNQFLLTKKDFQEFGTQIINKKFP